MAGLATKETNRSVDNFISQIDNASKQEDSKIILELLTKVTGQKPKVWGNDKAPDFLIGFGKYNYTRKGSKEEFEWFNVGFAPRKSKMTVYLTFDINAETELLKQLGKCKWGKGCLYINKVADIDLAILEKLVSKSKTAKWH
ncbi:DUF1801 domain-containing protein [Psychroserpens sp.]|uniref:DUF1801 domain-containing protein n=1 Tax=Psychroserpens sp. TaxID=2020870 RepID=UPI001B15918B|nr:DUF1801 domain-containing protein [Psychroserpens sp.]MBO6607192.1 DUF1801 domain-containing protein [Psychroserpens sp.]MBO6631296.1 DUF1801 domain-containing protein [Psychroserpens sp.]MBO6654338.1 DUF1801 domain-containing protein [Psychroserpens sp.]MBO6682376.1 DUF1801 domain-containing protein [Psychroserpens sp.]MBO6750964.1 DUF1801 domain-containing protein [Psychroserpens sp.]